MKILFRSLCISLATLALIQCKPDDNTTSVEVRDRQEVYNENHAEIETFLKTHKVTVSGNNELSFTVVPEGSAESIWNQTEYPLADIMLKNDTRTNYTTTGVINDPVEYKVYYLVINQGGGETAKTYDNHYTSYTGYSLDGTIFDKNNTGFWSSFPNQGNGTYSELISGYRQLTTLIKTAESINQNSDGSYTAVNPGRIVAFLPSGLGYFDTYTTNLGKYKPSIFDITFLTRNEIDHDGDGILTKYEDVDGDGNVWNDDTDGDGKPNFLDVDDDADGILTRTEITYQGQDENGNTVNLIYPFDLIPTCTGGTLKKHLDPACQ